MGVIYKVTNTINNKIYIGQTRLAEPQRWQQHVWHAYNNPEGDCVALCNAIKKYGRENFLREILENLPDENLDEREEYWISFYDSTNREVGYNLALGGCGHSKFTDEQIRQNFEKLGSVCATAKELQMSRDQVSRRLRAMGIETSRELPIKQYTVDGKLIAVFDNAAEASRKTGISASGITASASHTAGGYIWLRDRDGLTIEEYLKRLKQDGAVLPGIEQYDYNGELLSTFSSAAEAARKVGVNISSLKAALSGKQASAGGYLWRRVSGGLSYEDMLNKYLLSSTCCAVEETDKDGNVLNCFESSNKAEAFYGWGGNRVKPVCDGKRTTANGKYFRYANPKKRELIKQLGETQK